MPELMQTAYLYDGTLEGLLSTIFVIYAKHREPASIQPADHAQMVLGKKPITIPTRLKWAQRVKRGLVKKAGSPAFERLRNAYLAEEAEKEMEIYRYIKAALFLGKKVLHALSWDEVRKVEELSHSVLRETHAWLGFLRFSKLKDGLYYAKYAPKHNVTPLLMPHFTDRFSMDPFLIHDTGHDLIGVYDRKSWYLVGTDQLNLPSIGAEEEHYRQMWKSFFEVIAISERKNAPCQKRHMPLRYRADLPECAPDFPNAINKKS